MSRRREFDVIVVGAGAVGASLALALARDGFEVAAVEAREPAAWRADDEVDLRVVALAPDARELFGSMDVWTAIAASRSHAWRRMRVWDADAAGELHFDAADSGDAALGWIVENRLIQHVLWEAIADSDNVHVACPREVIAVSDRPDCVIATLDDDTSLRARVLIAAEGASSGVRGRLGIEIAARDYGQRAIVAHVKTGRPHEDSAWQRFQAGGPLAFLPLADGRSSIVWSRPDDDAARLLALDDKRFCEELGCAFDFRLGAITATTQRLAFPLRMRLAKNYVAGRCVLVGDAAHVVHPLAGQGMNLGLRDVGCLRRVLGAARARRSDIGAAHFLRRYERERRSENALAARGLDVIERVFGSRWQAVAVARGAALGIADRFVPLKRVLAEVAAGRA